MQHKFERRYDLDWLRVLTILSVLVYHVGMFFVPWDFHIKNNTTSEWFEYPMVWLHQWRLPLLLFISGAATMYAFNKRTLWQYVKERNKRLFIPLVFAMFVVVPPQIYVEKAGQFSSYFNFYPTVFEMVSYPKGSFSWHHMWFVAYLLLFSMLAVPIIAVLKSNGGAKFREYLGRYFSYKSGFISFVIVIVISQVLLRPYFPEETHDLTSDWAYFTFYFLFFVGGLLTTAGNGLWEVLKKQRRFHLYIAVASLVFTESMYIDWKLELGIYPDTGGLMWNFNKILGAWSWVITVAGYGYTYLNRSSKLLKFSNEGIYPFYILHQTVILLFGYTMMDWQMNIPVKFILLLVLSFVTTVGIYIIFIKPFNITRFLFGMKPKRRVTG